MRERLDMVKLMHNALIHNTMENLTNDMALQLITVNNKAMTLLANQNVRGAKLADGIYLVDMIQMSLAT